MKWLNLLGGLLCFTGTAILFPACSHNDRKQADNRTAKEEPVEEEGTEIQRWFLNPSLNGWSTRMHNKDSSFDITRFSPAGTDYLQLAPSGSSFDEESWKTYKPYFIFSPDHSSAIDLYSYGTIPEKQPDGSVKLEGGDPDSEVSLVDIKTRHKRRLLFGGPGTVFQQAAWVDDSTVIITGTSDANENNQTQPVLWKINLRDSTLISYNYDAR
jgi:hypothetical protein